MNTAWRRSAYAIALLPALAACGKVPSTAAHVTGARASATPTVTRISVSESGAGRVDDGDALPTPSIAPATDPDATGATAVGGTTVTGYVFADDGALLDGIFLTAKSLDPTRPFQASAFTQGGAYLFKGVPAGANVELTASSAGWTTRRRVVAFTDTAGRCDFGAMAGSKADGAAYFLSDRPEIVQVTPTDGNGQVDPATRSVTLKLSEPLDAANRARLERAVRVLPANDVANGGVAGSTTDLGALPLTFPMAIAVDGASAIDPYDVRKGSVFMGQAATPAACSWNDDGDALTLTLPGPMVTSVDAAAAYQIALVSSGPDQAVRDGADNALGGDTLVSPNGYPDAGQLVPGAFYDASRLDLTAATGLSGANARWAATHRNVSRFEVAEHDVVLALSSVHATTVGNDTRLELTFSLPMAANNGQARGFTSPTLASAEALSRFTFALGEDAHDLAGIALDRDPSMAPVDPRSATSFGAAGDMGKPFRFSPDAFASGTAATGSVVVSVDPQDAHRVLLTLVGRPHFFESRAALLTARAAGVEDAAGHRLTSTAAVTGGL